MLSAAYLGKLYVSAPQLQARSKGVNATVAKSASSLTVSFHPPS